MQFLTTFNTRIHHTKMIQLNILTNKSKMLRMKSLMNLIGITLTCTILIGCTNNYQTFNQERLNYNWDYIILTPTQTLKTKDNKEIIIDKEIRVWSDKAYLELNEKLMNKF